MKNLIKIAFTLFVSLSLTSCMSYNNGYADSYGDPYYDNGNYYAPQGYYNTGGYYGNDGYYYRDNMQYNYDNGVPYYYGNNRNKVYVEKRSSTQRPASGFRDTPTNNGTYTNPRNNNNTNSTRSKTISTK
ncbi:MAG: hypothetical protein EOO20_25155 [Chryseobacterium sp.]|nr:MAG: hypothetical protein EOO20_25155 [Chryseobacterium sp.]